MAWGHFEVSPEAQLPQWFCFQSKDAAGNAGTGSDSGVSEQAAAWDGGLYYGFPAEPGQQKVKVRCLKRRHTRWSIIILCWLRASVWHLVQVVMPADSILCAQVGIDFTPDELKSGSMDDFNYEAHPAIAELIRAFLDQNWQVNAALG